MIRVTRLERDSQLEGQIESGMRRTDWNLGMMEEPVERKGYSYWRDYRVVIIHNNEHNICLRFVWGPHFFRVFAYSTLHPHFSACRASISLKFCTGCLHYPIDKQR